MEASPLNEHTPRYLAKGIALFEATDDELLPLKPIGIQVLGDGVFGSLLCVRSLAFIGLLVVLLLVISGKAQYCRGYLGPMASVLLMTGGILAIDDSNSCTKLSISSSASN